MHMLLAEHIARKAHATQTDRAGKPYIGHVERVVANLLKWWPDASEDEISAAWLHDVDEDTPWTPQQLLEAGVSPAAVSIMREVSRPVGVTYKQWIADLSANGSISAVKVKIADNLDNSSPKRVAAIPEGAEMLAKRYQPARVMLEARLLRDGHMKFLTNEAVYNANCAIKQLCNGWQGRVIVASTPYIDHGETSQLIGLYETRAGIP